MFGNLLIMRVSYGNGGWVAVDGLDLPGPLYVRLRDVDGRLRITEFYLDASESAASIESADVTRLPLRQIEAVVNRDADEVLGPRDRMSWPAPELSVLASYFSSSFMNTLKQLSDGNWVVASMAAQQLSEQQRATVHPAEGSEPYVIKVGRDRRPGEGPALMRVPRNRNMWKNVREIDSEFRLMGGPDAGLTDAFLADVARAYAAAVARGERPNKALAEQTNYPLKTTQRWVYTARQRGIMPPGKKGAAG